MAVYPATLSLAQQRTVDHYQELNVPAQWFVGEPSPKGRVEVLALGEDFIWSFLIERDGGAATAEASIPEGFSTGIEA